MSVKRAEKELSFIDGEAIVSTGYTLDGMTVEPYE
jgi:hypothetical protein